MGEHESIRRAIEATAQRSPLSSNDFRLGGTAASLLHGVDLPVGDVDFLVGERHHVDLLASALQGFPILVPPHWLAYSNGGQYWARFDVEGVQVEFSTVEFATDSDALECIGSGPWVHYLTLPCRSVELPVVALELRLVSEVFRDRAERYRPIVEHLRSKPCDLALIRRGLTARRISETRQAQVLAMLGL
jgi:hypothetical protein